MNRRTRPWESAFPAALESTGIVSHAAKAAEVGRRTVYDHLKADPEFYEKTQDALATSDGNLQMELMHRAVEGVQQPVYYRGEVVGQSTRKNDSLLMFAIRNLRQQRSELERTQPFGGLSNLLDFQDVYACGGAGAGGIDNPQGLRCEPDSGAGSKCGAGLR